MAAIVEAGAAAIGVDVAEPLLRRASRYGRVHRARIPPFDFLEKETVDGVVVVLVLEHLEEERALFSEAARVTRSGGTLALVINHPVWTAPGSTPIDDEDETLWRPGEYFSRGASEEPAGDHTVVFHHRSLAELLSAAADAGWCLERIVEQSVTEAQIERTPGLAGQEQIPRLLGARWRRS